MIRLLGLVSFCLVVYNPTIAYGISERDTAIDCSTADTTAFCLDCYTKGICAGSDPISQACAIGEVCQQSVSSGRNVANCVAPSNIPGCVCPADSFTRMPDVYDNQKYIVCVGGQGQIQTCDPIFYDPEIMDCSATSVTPTVPPTTSEPGSCTYTGSGGTQFERENCVSFRLCLQSGELTDVVFCDVSEVFNEVTGECQPFEVFSCSDFPNTVGLVGDSTNCTIFHFCQNGVEDGDPLICPENTTFNNVSMQCESGLACSSVEGCTCQAANTFIAFNCTNYYECVENPPGFYNPIFKRCPTGFYFNPSSNRCERTVEGCPPSLTK